jgi:hypothetical protein
MARETSPGRIERTPSGRPFTIEIGYADPRSRPSQIEAAAARMSGAAPRPHPQRREIAARLVELFYIEVLLLIDEAQAYLDHPELGDGSLEPELCEAIGAAFETLFVRLEAVRDWLLARRAPDAQAPFAPLATVPGAEDEEAVLSRFPDPAAGLARSGRDLYERIVRLEQGLPAAFVPTSPARQLIGRLKDSF